MIYFTADTYHFNYGKNNPNYKGEKAGYNAMHSWVRNRLSKPIKCNKCKKKKSLELSNKSGQYKRNLNDWEYLCRKCHMDIDGRSELLRKSGKNRKFRNIKCKLCKNFFHPSKKINKFCSEKCYHNARKDNSNDIFRKRYAF